MDFPINKTGSVTDPVFLYRSLGSFWTDIFQDKETLKGYTKGQAEEITQRYLDLIEAINSFSATDIDVFHTEKWKPIHILKSKINEVPFIFKGDDGVFGAQPSTSEYYAGITFKFGESKKSPAKIYQYYVGKNLVNFSVIADRVINPTKLYISGCDVIIDNGALLFNTNVFDDPAVVKFEVFDDNGDRLTYVDSAGKTQFEESCILWAYNGQTDINNLYNSFGYIFKLRQESSEVYKKILEGLVALFVNGPTVAILKKLFATFSNLPFVLNPQETVENIFKTTTHHVIVTDKEVYQVPITYTLNPLAVGQLLSYGDYLSSNIEVFDSLSGASGWWKRTGLINKQLAFSRCLFYGAYTNQLSFSSEIDLVTLDSVGNIVFPVLGESSDVAKFNKYLNSSTQRKTAIKEVFSLVSPGDSAIVNPLDFIMDNFLKQNTVLFKLDIPTHEDLAKILALVPQLKAALPPYVYFILKISTSIDVEVFSNLNGEVVDIAFTDPDVANTSADGSNETGEIEKLAPFYYNSVNSRLFEIAKALATQPFEMVSSSSSVIEGDVTVIEGKLRTSPSTGNSTAEFNKFLFLDFS